MPDDILKPERVDLVQDRGAGGSGRTGLLGDGAGRELRAILTLAVPVMLSRAGLLAMTTSTQ